MTEKPASVSGIRMSRQSPKTKLLTLQRRWARRNSLEVDVRGYLSHFAKNLFQPLSTGARDGFESGSGSELRASKRYPAKMSALHSSSALAVNFFDYWTGRKAEPLLRALNLPVAPVSIRFEQQFPTGLEGKPPNLDIAFFLRELSVVGIECKFTEWLTRKSPNKELFRPKYFAESRGLWVSKRLPRCQSLVAELHTKSTHFKYLDAAQLLKHALGLATQYPARFELYYFYYEIPGPESEIHRAEIATFANRIGADFRFHWGTYQDVARRLTAFVGPDDIAYMGYLEDRYLGNAVSADDGAQYGLVGSRHRSQVET